MLNTRPPPFSEDATLDDDGSNYILTLVDGFLIPKENKSLEDESRVEISGLETFPTPVTSSPATVVPERHGSVGNSSENVPKTALASSVGGEESGTGGHPDSNVVETEAEFPKISTRRISGINE